MNEERCPYLKDIFTATKLPFLNALSRSSADLLCKIPRSDATALARRCAFELRRCVGTSPDYPTIRSCSIMTWLFLQRGIVVAGAQPDNPSLNLI
jgi:hypothetical protein